MALVIRLRQQGKTNRRSFRLVVTDARSPRDGKYLEKLGSYDPHVEGAIEVNSERVEYWMDQGAMISDKAKALVLKKSPEVINQYLDKKMQIKLEKQKKEKAKKKA
jgi:small subunit ribosomal protein S16